MTSLPPADEAGPLAQPAPAKTEEGEAPPVAAQAQQRFQWRSFGRWLLMAPLRLLYRYWTRIAARLFPEDTQRARLAEQVGVPLPDRLDLSWVTRSLAVGGRVREEDIARLARAGITRVVDTRAEYRDDEAALNREGIQLLYLPAPDTHPLTVEDLLEGSAWALQQIRDGERVLIHCEHGVGRSVLLTCAVLVRDGYSAEAALQVVQAKRWQASPNHRQIKRLHEFEEALQAEYPRSA
jgi:protein tyrosine phosphatase (PTP) superfamily phosphohydrolase (DUF442 family)